MPTKSAAPAPAAETRVYDIQAPEQPRTPIPGAPSPAETSDWDRVKNSRDLFSVAAYRSTHPDSPMRQDIDDVYLALRDEELANMLSNPSKYSRQYVEALMAEGIFTYQELIDHGLITPESWRALQSDRDSMPDMAEFSKDQAYEQAAPPQGTDIYFFGMPTSGKTALLMGIAAANGQGYTVDMRTNGGPYAAALRQYTQEGIMPGRTPGKFVTTIAGNVTEVKDSGKEKYHEINLVEMSGEEFALRIAETKEPSLANMGTGVTNLLRNDNRKVFFVVVDASRPKVKVSYLDHEVDDLGEITQRVRSRYISQLDILDKFVVLMGLPENQEIMNKVDAIHFIVTKADTLGPEDQREQAAVDLINNHYLSVVEQLRTFCHRNHHIDRTSENEPLVYTFSLGKFYLGDVFKYDPADTLRIIDAIRDATHSGFRGWWDKMKANWRMV